MMSMKKLRPVAPVTPKTVDAVEKGVSFSVPVPEIVRPSDKLYKVVER